MTDSKRSLRGFSVKWLIKKAIPSPQFKTVGFHFRNISFRKTRVIAPNTITESQEINSIVEIVFFINFCHAKRHVIVTIKMVTAT